MEETSASSPSFLKVVDSFIIAANMSASDSKVMSIGFNQMEVIYSEANQQRVRAEFKEPTWIWLSSLLDITREPRKSQLVWLFVIKSPIS